MEYRGLKMVDSKQKGSRAETALKTELIKLTGHKWERIPLSGALNARHGLKGDLYIVGVNNIYCVEVKHYAEDQISSKILTTSVKSTIAEWWEQTIREAHEINKKPLLVFKHDRSKWLVAVDDLLIPQNTLPAKYIYIGHLGIWVLKLDDFISHCKPNFVI